MAENDSWCFYEGWWFSIAVFVYQRVTHSNTYNSPTLLTWKDISGKHKLQSTFFGDFRWSQQLSCWMFRKLFRKKWRLFNRVSKIRHWSMIVVDNGCFAGALASLLKGASLSAVIGLMDHVPWSKVQLHLHIRRWSSLYGEIECFSSTCLVYPVPCISIVFPWFDDQPYSIPFM